MTVELLQEGLPRVLEQAGQATADLPEKAAAFSGRLRHGAPPWRPVP